MTRFLLAILSILVAAGLVAFAIANRNLVTVSFDPFDPSAPAYVVTLPLYLLAFVLLILGVALGGVVAWFNQGKRRRYRRRLEAELKRVRAELDQANREAAARDAALRDTRGTPLPPAAVPARLPAH
jgi:hypothetical protein